ncbi:MAG TPA: N,N-dimethylformamidase beta subunit family domain-containing protein [Streptosporangiaceae bacterium]|nr:N,N-dimethylformamidase beta subunit family domain-containing protein [Streptosporangiaceae bacterium]
MTRCYAWPLTVGAGSDLQLHVSTQVEEFDVRLFRIGAAIEEVAVETGRYRGREMPLGRPDEAWGWPRYQVPLGAELTDGVYVAVPVPAGASGAVIADETLLTRPDAALFVLRRQAPDPGRRKILYKLPTATYAAYNQLGGVSLYAGANWVRDWSAQGYVVSLQRPGNGGVGGKVMEGDAPDLYARASRRQVFAHWDAPFIAWLERRGYALTYCTDFDLHDDQMLLADDALVLSAGHDEYWSSQMRRRILEFVDRGGNICFFAGDVACFEVEFGAAGDRLYCRKMAGGGPDGGANQIGALWHVNDPEDWLTLSSGAYGGGWWDGRRAIDGYHAVNPAHWAFDGVEFPPDGITGGDETPVIGYETDGVRLERASSPPRLSEHRKGGGGGRSLLALARLSAGWVAGPDQANAAIMIRTAPSGGITFSVGTTDWPLALADEAVGRITQNVVSKLASRSLIIHGPVFAQGEAIGEGDLVGPGRAVRWYLDGAQADELGLRDVRWRVTPGSSVSGDTVSGDTVSGDAAGLLITTESGADDGWLTVTATAVTATGEPCFGSRTVRVADTVEYLRRRIVRALNAMANPDEQGGALVDQHASEASLADRVIPVRLPWVREYARTLTELMAQLEAIWTADGRMAEGALRPDEL